MSIPMSAIFIRRSGGRLEVHPRFKVKKRLSNKELNILNQIAIKELTLKEGAEFYNQKLKKDISPLTIASKLRRTKKLWRMKVDKDANIGDSKTAKAIIRSRYGDNGNALLRKLTHYGFPLTATPAGRFFINNLKTNIYFLKKEDLKEDKVWKLEKTFSFITILVFPNNIIHMSVAPLWERSSGIGNIVEWSFIPEADTPNKDKFIGLLELQEIAYNYFKKAKVKLHPLTTKPILTEDERDWAGRGWK